VVTALSDFGLTYLMFLAGTEVDVATMRRGHIGLAAGSWVASLVLALLMGVLFHSSGLVLDSVVVALCLTTTALGTLLPMLRDSGVLDTPFGPRRPLRRCHRGVRPDPGRIALVDAA
jgi:Kef-type K+ transport system membrane component KefB